MKKSLFLLIAFLTATLCARAEENAAKLALAREAISAMQADKMLDNMSGQLKAMAMQQAQMPANATPADQKNFEEFVTNVTNVAMSEAKSIISKMDVVYAEIYTEQELKAITAFFKSPEGSSMMSKQPQIMAKVMPLVKEMQQAMIPQIQQLTMDFKAKMTPPAAPSNPAIQLTPAK